MKVRKMIKNIVALGTGLTMLGATVFGAMATDLGQYPNQYIKDGVFDGLMVVGAAASTSDVLGIVDIATSLQFQSKTDKVITDGSGKTVTSLSGDAYEFGTSSNKLEVNEFIGNVKSTVTADDFGLLTKSTVRTRKGTTDVKQYLKFNASSGLEVVYDEENDVIGHYLKCADKEALFTYEVQFTDGLYSDIYKSTNSNDKSTTGIGYLNDLNDKSIYMLGHSYTITEGEVKDCTNGDVRLTLMTGSVELSMQEYESKVVTIDDKDYDIKVIIVSDGASNDANSVKIMVNNEETNKLYEGDTYTFNDGIILGVKSILSNEGAEVGGQDIVSFYLGANKIEFDNGKVEVEEERIEDASVEVKCNVIGNDEIRISSIKYTLYADADKSGDLIVMKDESVRDALDEPQGMLGINWDIQYLGLTGEEGRSEVRIDTDGDDRYELSFMTQNDVEYNMPLVYVTASDSIMHYGEDDEYKLVLNAADVITENDYFILTSDPGNIDGITHVLQLDEVDEDENVVIFSEVGTGETIEMTYDKTTKKGDLIVGGGTFEVNTISTAGVNVPGVSKLIRLNNGHKMEINAFDNIVFTTPATLTDDGVNQLFTIKLSVDANGEDVDLDVVGLDMISDDSDYRRGTTKFGVEVKENTDDVDELLISIPEGQIFPSVVLTGQSFTIGSTNVVEGGITIPEYTAISVGKAILDSELGNMAADNVIVVGGPCANTVAATILGIPSTMPECYEQFPVKEGEGIIRMIENGENVAMLVAGYTAQDTRNAAKIVAQFSNYEEQLKNNSEVIVSGTTIKVATVETETNTTNETI